MQLFLMCICGHISVMCCHSGMSQTNTEDCYLLSACGAGRYILGVFPHMSHPSSNGAMSVELKKELP